MSDIVVPPPLDRTVIDLLIDAAAPEQAAEWRLLCTAYQPSFHLLQDRKGITMQARGRRVEFDSKTLGWIWLLSFASWRAFRLHGPHLFLRWLSGRPIDSAMRAADPGFAEAEADYEAVLYVIRDLFEVEELNEDDGWPAGIPRRQADKSGFDIEQQAAFDLTMIATAYTLLHEVRHVMFNVDVDRPLRREEEMACDAFARNFILDRVDAYAERSDELREEVFAKRAAGVALGAYILHEFTPAEGKAGDEDYPPVADRIEALIAGLPADDKNWFWDFASPLLIAVLKRRDRDAGVPDVSGPDLCRELIRSLRQTS